MSTGLVGVFNLLLNLVVILIIIAAFVLVIITCMKVIKYVDFRMKDKK